MNSIPRKENGVVTWIVQTYDYEYLITTLQSRMKVRDFQSTFTQEVMTPIVYEIPDER